MSLNHRTRLAFVSAATTGLILVALFAAIALFSRRDVMQDKRGELLSVMRSFTPPSDPSFDIDEFYAAHPELSAAVYGFDGRRIRGVGRRPPPCVAGFQERDGRLTLGTVFQGQRVVIALDLREVERGLETLDATLVAVWFPLTLLIGGIAWANAQAVFRPLERLSVQALSMTGKNLAERLDPQDAAEFGAFAQNLNTMLDRIEATVRRGQRFSTDAAHEFRTPLAILRTRLETALLQPRTPEVYRDTIRRSVEEIGRLTAITESLLRSARGESTDASWIALEPLVREAVERWVERYSAEEVRLASDTVPACATILPEEARVVLDNLLDNALRYAPPGSEVVVSLKTTGREATIQVRDAGPGVDPKLGYRIFDRFTRADDSRNRISGGSGIGLAVCRQIVDDRGGEMTINELLEKGAEIGCRFPSYDG